MAVYVVGDFLRETRLRKGYTQEEVSYGICTPASLSRIENGAQKPGRLILEKLFERLGTENNLFNSFVSREEMELYSEIQTLIRDITDEDVARLEKQIDVVEKMAQNASELEHQCLYFAKGELARQKEKDDAMAMEYYLKAIRITLPDFDGKMKTAKYPMILYNLSCWFYDQQCYKEAVKIADTGIDFCVKYGNLAAFPRLVLNKGVSLAECGEIDKAQKYLHQAIIIFEAMQRIDTVQLINTWCKDHYQLEV